MTVSSASVLPAFSTHNFFVVDFVVVFGPLPSAAREFASRGASFGQWPGVQHVSRQGSRKTTTAHQHPPPTSTHRPPAPSPPAICHVRPHDWCGRNPREIEDGRGETRGSRLQAGSRFTTALRLFNDENNHEAVLFVEWLCRNKITLKVIEPNLIRSNTPTPRLGRRRSLLSHREAEARPQKTLHCARLTEVY